jgi:hypothetical protein
MPADDFIDTKKVSTSIAQRAVDRILDIAEEKIRERWAKHKNKTTKAFSDYIIKQTKRCAVVRTLIYDKQSARFEDIYVPQFLSVSKRGDWRSTREVVGEEFTTMLVEARDPGNFRPNFCGLIFGPAGSGKSFLMRYLFLTLAKQKLDKIPVFIEARNLNDRKLTDLAGTIASEFESLGIELSREQALDALNTGLFIVLIDGIDELNRTVSGHYSKELIRSAEIFQSCPLVVSGRPSESMLSWSQFEICEMLPLKVAQVISLQQTYF